VIVERYIKENKVGDMNKVTPQQITRWINKKGATGYRRRKLVMSVVKSFHNYCFQMGWTKRNPADIVKVKTDNLTHKQKEVKRVEAFTEQEVDALVLYLDMNLMELKSEYQVKVVNKATRVRPHSRGTRMVMLNRRMEVNRFWKSAILLSYETALRLSDICQLEWDCLTDTELVVHTEKRDKRVAIPLWNKVKEAINSIPHDDDDYCFPKQRKILREHSLRANLSRDFIKLMKDAGVTRAHLSFHSLRHACLTKWNSTGFDIEHIQKLAGHSNTETTKGYIHS
jgi:integrase